MKKPVFTLRKNIAMKVPTHEYKKTVFFYKDVLGLLQVESFSLDSFESVAFKFGNK